MTIQNEPPNLFYRGFSMKGTFKPGDRLSIEKITFNQVRRGDLIVFTRTHFARQDYVIHRVRDISRDGLIMRGDNSGFNDQKKVTRNAMVGRVTCYNRNGRIHNVSNGPPGRLRGALLHTRLNLKRLLKCFFLPVYRALLTQGVASRIWRPEFQIIRFNTPDGPLIKYVHKNRTAAAYWVKKDAWFCRPPYDLVLKGNPLKFQP